MNRKPPLLFAGDASSDPAASPKPRLRPRLEPEFPFDLFAEALGWVHKSLRKRQWKELSEIAKGGHVGERTLRDLEQQKHLNTALAPYYYAYALGYPPDRVALITRRWLRKYLRQVRPRRSNDGLWNPPFSWQHKTCQTNGELSQFP